MSRTLDWSEHIAEICTKSLKRINAWKSVHYKLSRKHLEMCMSLFVFPILDYGDILYDNCSELDKTMLEDTQLAAARVVVGAKKGTSHARLYNELGWQPLRRRREIHKLCKIYDIINDYTPNYLSNQLPRNLNASRRFTRGAAMGNFAVFRCKTETFRKSFFPLGINLFNNLAAGDKSLPRNAFKNKMRKSMKTPVPLHFYEGSRKYNIVLSQMRLRFCNLNFYLYQKGCIDSASCQCGNGPETLNHYFFVCDSFTDQRDNMLMHLGNILTPGTNVDVDLLLTGRQEFDSLMNSAIVECVIEFIVGTNRF